MGHLAKARTSYQHLARRQADLKESVHRVIGPSCCVYMQLNYSSIEAVIVVVATQTYLHGRPVLRPRKSGTFGCTADLFLRVAVEGQTLP